MTEIKKRKNLKKAEREYILEHFDKEPLDNIALALHCHPDDLKSAVRAAQRDTGRIAFDNQKVTAAPTVKKVELDFKIDILTSLRGSLVWKKMQEELEPDEVKYFEEEYVKLVEQFKSDVVATEDNQIRKAITFDILMRRNMAARKKLLADIVRMENWQERSAREYKAKKDTLNDDERRSAEEFMLNLETQLAALRSAEQSKTKEFSDLDTRHQKLMEALKATRDQRFSKVESNKVSFLAVLKDLMREEKAKQEDKMLSLMQGASDRELKRLSKPHIYEDGVSDQPILSAETIGEAPQEENDEGDDN